MKKLFSAILILTGFVFNISAQSEYDREYFTTIEKDYRGVRAVARVKVKGVEPVEDRGYVTYAVKGEIVESFKGEFEPGQPVKFYFVAEPASDIKRYPKESIVFLEGKHPIKSASGEKGWFELENSRREPTVENISIMRGLKSVPKKIVPKRRTAIRRTGKRIARLKTTALSSTNQTAFAASIRAAARFRL